MSTAIDESQATKRPHKTVSIVQSSKADCLADPCLQTQKRWFAVRYKPRQERSVLSNLSRANITVYFPQIRVSKNLGFRGKSIEAPLFPGYLFAKFSLGLEYRIVKYARGVQGVVSFGITPAVVDEELILAIQERIASTADLHQFRKGETVRIQSGPLRGIEAVFEKQIPPCERVIILLRALSFQAKVEVDLKDIVNL